MNILFVCTGNTCRSPMAEVIANDFFKKYSINHKIFSAGIYGESEKNISFNVSLALSKIGMKLIRKKSQIINKEILKKTDIIITMTEHQKKTIITICENNKININKINTISFFAIGKKEDIPDPYMLSLDEYIYCRDKIKFYIEKIKWEEL